MLKGNFCQKISMANIIEQLLKSYFGVYLSPILEAWKVLLRPVEVLCDITLHLAAYQTTVETQRHSSGMSTHAGQHSQLPGMHTLVFAGLLYIAYRNSTETDDVTPNLRSKAPLRRLLEGFFFHNLRNFRVTH